MIRWYDKDGNEIDMLAGDSLLSDPAYARVALTKIKGCDCSVSTVWLGLDHNWWAEYGPPLIFETMIFGLPDGEEYMRRYPTEAAALAGHDQAVAWLCDFLIAHGGQS